MKRLFRIYFAFVKKTIIDRLNYRTMFISSLIGIVLEPLVYMIIWFTVAKSNGGVINGKSFNYFLAYYIFLLIVNNFTLTYLLWLFQQHVQLGELTNYLLMPINIIHSDMGDIIGHKVVSMPIIILTAIIMGFVFNVNLNIQFYKLLLFIPSLILSFFIRFLFDWTIALNAFWIVNTRAINSVYYTASLFFSGRVAPLSMFPETIQTFIKYLPFRYTVSFPIEILLNDLSSKEIFLNLIIQCWWLIALIIFSAYYYKICIKKYTSVGI